MTKSYKAEMAESMSDTPSRACAAFDREQGEEPDGLNNPFGAGNPYSPNSPTNPDGRGLRIEGR